MFQEFSQATPGTCEEKTTIPNTHLFLYPTEDTIHNNPVTSCLTIIYVVDKCYLETKTAQYRKPS